MPHFFHEKIDPNSLFYETPMKRMIMKRMERIGGMGQHEHRGV